MNKNQVLCHNEFTIVGRVSDEIKYIGDNIIRILILCPNDENYNQLANKIYVDFDSKDHTVFEKMIGCAIAVTGHIEFDNRLKLISDMYQFVN